MYLESKTAVSVISQMTPTYLLKNILRTNDQTS